MIEQRDMWVVERDLVIRPIEAIYDTKKNKVISYRYQEEQGYPYDPEECTLEHYFDTEGEAINWRNEEVARLKEMMPTVKAFAERMDCIKSDNEYLPHEKSDYGWPDGDDEDRDDYFEQMGMFEGALSLVGQALRTGFLNINRQAVRISEVVRVEWVEERWQDEDGNTCTRSKAKLILRDGTGVTTRTESELKAVEQVFDENFSWRSYTKNIQPPEDDE